MRYLKDTCHYNEAFTELNFDFGDFYLFENFVVGEVRADVVFNWENHAKQMVEEVSALYEQHGKNLIYISNRVNRYSVVPTDWRHFFNFSYSLKGYGIVNYSEQSLLSNGLEKLFFGGRLKSFRSLSAAIQWAKHIGDYDDTIQKAS